MKKLKFGAGLWTIGFSADRFIPGGYRPLESFEKQIEAAARIKDSEAVQIHYPSDFEGLETKEVANIIKDKGLKMQAMNMSLYSADFKYGAFTNANEKIYRKAIDMVKKGVDAAREIGFALIDMWPGQDGHDYCSQGNYDYMWNSTVSAIKEIVEYAPDMKFSYEYKSKEPRMFMMVSNVGKALILTHDVGAENFGITLDFGHALLSRENPAESLCFLNRAGKLFNVHINDAYGEFDDDLIAGTVNVWRTIEYLWYLKQTDYDGYLILDQFPFREDPVEACSLSIRMLKSMEDIADSLDSEAIRNYQKNDNISGLFDMLRKKVQEYK